MTQKLLQQTKTLQVIKITQTSKLNNRMNFSFFEGTVGMKNRAYLTDPAKKPYHGWWCSVTCSCKDRNLCQLCKLFQELNCTGRPPKKARNSFWCVVTCEHSVFANDLSSDGRPLCPFGMLPDFHRLNC